MRKSLVRVPLVAAFSALKERSHRFVGRPDLNLFKESAIVLAVVIVHALRSCLVDVFPCVSATQDVVDFLTVKLHLILDLLFNDEHVRAGLAEEPEV